MIINPYSCLVLYVYKLKDTPLVCDFGFLLLVLTVTDLKPYKFLFFKCFCSLCSECVTLHEVC